MKINVIEEGERMTTAQANVEGFENKWDEILKKPADFVIKTPTAFRYFLLKRRREKAAYKPSQALKLILRFPARLQVGEMNIILPDQTKLHYIGRQAGPSVTLVIHNDRVANKFLMGGRLGFCESYLDGDWSSPDIAQFFTLILENAEIMRKTLHGKSWYRFLSGLIHTFRPNTKKGSQKNIYQHYDIGNAFYKRWLDPSMTYSSALYRNGAQSLEEAQREKYANLAKMTDIRPDHHVLEIGCGWGGMAEYVAGEIGAKVTCVTISHSQYEYAVKRMKEKGLSDKVEILLKDYRDIEGQFDRVVSIEMFEAVGEQYWSTYFDKVKSSLKPQGKAGFQIITIDNEHFPSYRKSADYIQRYIFPGGMLPSPEKIREVAGASGLTWEGAEFFGRDYARTLAEWNRNFQTVWPEIEKDFDGRFKRLWEQYLCYCQAGFQVGTIDVGQIVLKG